MQLMAWLSDSSDKPNPEKHAELPAFLESYRRLGFRLHVEGHTHVALESDLHFPSPQENRNYAYINLGAWRDRIVPKLGRGYRRRSTGRALVIESRPVEQIHSYTLRDITSWGSHLDAW